MGIVSGCGLRTDDFALLSDFALRTGDFALFSDFALNYYICVYLVSFCFFYWAA